MHTVFQSSVPVGPRTLLFVGLVMWLFSFWHVVKIFGVGFIGDKGELALLRVTKMKRVFQNILGLEAGETSALGVWERLLRTLYRLKGTIDFFFLFLYINRPSIFLFYLSPITVTCLQNEKLRKRKKGRTHMSRSRQIRIRKTII